MTVFKCDICGAYYEPYNFYFNNQTDDKPNSLMLYAKREKSGDAWMTRYNLCPECMKAVNQLIEDRKRLEPSIGGNDS